MRWGALARNGLVIAAWAGAIWALIATEAEWRLAVALGIAATVVAGVVLGRWWALLVPGLAFAVFFLIAFAQDPSCRDCGEDPWNLQALFGIALFVLPATTAIALGVGLRRGARLARRRSRPHEQPAP
jgi:hypothetical protein